jgi:CheY-like chemotaxis protein
MKITMAQYFAFRLVTAPMQTSLLRSLPRLDGSKVLIVDDDADIRDTLELFLTMLGAEVKQAASGEEGLQQWSTWDPSVVLSDITMPRLSGHQFIHALRLAEHTQGRRYTPAIAVSAYSNPRDIASAKAAGFDEFVAKPADPQELAEIVKEYCSRSEQ